MKRYIRNNWWFLLFCAALAIMTTTQSDVLLTSLVTQVFFYLVVLPVLHYLFQKVIIQRLGANKSGPITIYQSPVFWLGIPTILVLIYVFV